MGKREIKLSLIQIIIIVLFVVFVIAVAAFIILRNKNGDTAEKPNPAIGKIDDWEYDPKDDDDSWGIFSSRCFI